MASPPVRIPGEELRLDPRSVLRSVDVRFVPCPSWIWPRDRSMSTSPEAEAAASRPLSVPARTP